MRLYGDIGVGMTPGTFVTGEEYTLGPTPGQYYRSMNLPPNSDSVSTFLETLRVMLVNEELTADGTPDGLQLAYSVPAAWLQQGKTTTVRNAPTDFGSLSHTINGMTGQSAGPGLLTWIRLTNGVTTAETPGGPFRHELEFSHEYTPSVNCTCWMDAGPTAPTMWLRLYHRTDPASGDGLWQAQSSRDGITWVTAGTWWFPADAGTPQIGIAALNAPGATATFRYFRVYDGAPG